MDRLKVQADNLVGEHIIVRGKDYGHVVSYDTISDGYDSRYILCTDLGKRVELTSLLRYLNKVISVAVRPDGSDYADRMAQPKKLYRANAMCAANIDTNAHIGNEIVNIAKRPTD